MRICAVVTILILILVAVVAAESGKTAAESKAGTAPAAVSPASASPVAAPAAVLSATAQTNASIRVEGEKRFRTNCGRCHMAPHKFPPRMMATIVRHMRVRALITDEDMRYILAYMTE